jgi:hypothetical protein
MLRAATFYSDGFSGGGCRLLQRWLLRQRQPAFPTMASLAAASPAMTANFFDDGQEPLCVLSIDTGLAIAIRDHGNFFPIRE